MSLEHQKCPKWRGFLYQNMSFLHTSRIILLSIWTRWPPIIISCQLLLVPRRCDNDWAVSQFVVRSCQPCHIVWIILRFIGPWFRGWWITNRQTWGFRMFLKMGVQVGCSRTKFSRKCRCHQVKSTFPLELGGQVAYMEIHPPCIHPPPLLARCCWLVASRSIVKVLQSSLLCFAKCLKPIIEPTMICTICKWILSVIEV